ncbi:MAG: indolepyruvate oxidoreductase subunit beta family protein [Bradyrhizobiaceae bacterium]|nr:indolepyruvate oxidoreductase subunit beta family protein [Bradyrhizobiaceae bacterium]
MTDLAAPPRPITIAIFALGGEGGGVLTDWIVDTAERGGYLVQATSVPGVAQRTGATIYYVEIFPRAAAETAGCEPVLALMPTPGQVDIVIASELMEAGRAIERGFVTPDRTMLIASTHRVYSIDERMALGDARVDETALREACQAAAKQVIAFDMQAVADGAGSQINAALFGALAASGALPFSQELFERAVAAHASAANSNQAAFTAASVKAMGESASSRRPVRRKPGRLRPSVVARLKHLRPILSEESLSLICTGVERLTDYQDDEYANEYLRLLLPFIGLERERGHGDDRLLLEVARATALNMAYEDAIRVAELKIRSERLARIDREAGLRGSQVLEVTDFFHPRTEEIADVLPAALGSAVKNRPWARRFCDRLGRGGRTVRTTTVLGYLSLYLVASLKPLRRRSLRFKAEKAALSEWIEAILHIAANDYELAVEFAKCRSMIKGYGDTHARTAASFDVLAAAAPMLLGKPNAPSILRQLREAALKDEEGSALKNAVKALGKG